MTEWINMVWTDAPESSHHDIRWAIATMSSHISPPCNGDDIEGASNTFFKPPSDDLPYFIQYYSEGEPTDEICHGLAEQFPDYRFVYVDEGEAEDFGDG